MCVSLSLSQIKRDICDWKTFLKTKESKKENIIDEIKKNGIRRHNLTIWSKVNLLAQREREKRGKERKRERKRNKERGREKTEREREKEREREIEREGQLGDTAPTTAKRPYNLE